MTDPQLSTHRDRRAAGLGATIALHLALIPLWQMANKPNPDGPEQPSRLMQWVDVIAAPRKAAQPEPKEPEPVPRTPPERKVAPPVRAIAIAPPVPATPELVTAAPPEAPQQRSADDIMQQARRDMGKINKELKKEFPGPKIRAPVDTPQSRLVKGIELAHEMAPPKLWEAPKVQELTTGFAGTRRYRVITGNGTYCITVGPTHTATGLTMNGNANAQRLTSCPRDELPATTQNYDERP